MNNLNSTSSNSAGTGADIRLHLAAGDIRRRRNKLALHGLQQYYLKLEESQKNRKLNDLLDTLDFN
jgi:hypothetical protein